MFWSSRLSQMHRARALAVLVLPGLACSGPSELEETSSYERSVELVGPVPSLVCEEG